MVSDAYQKLYVYTYNKDYVFFFLIERRIIITDISSARYVCILLL